MDNAEVVVRVSDVTKKFVLRQEKSLKERLVNFGQSQKYKQQFTALNNINLDILSGSTVGLIGANGSGKSTLLKAIGGIIQPDAGTVSRKGRLAALLELGAGFHPDLTGRENVYLNAAILGLSKEETNQKFDEIVDFSGIGDFIDTQVKFYSSGMYVRLAFAVAIHVDPDILIIDEVLAVGDEPFQRKCLDSVKQLQNKGKTIILVSHALEQVGELCDRVIVLDKGTVIFDGDPAIGISSLREGFEESRIKNLHDENLENRSAQVGTVTLLSKGVPLSKEQPVNDESIEIQVTLSNTSMAENYVIGIGIETPLGHVVYGTNTQFLGLELHGVTQEGKYTFVLSDIRLGAGTYFVHASVGTSDRGEIHRISQAASFDIAGNGKSTGTARFNVTFQQD